MVSTSRTHYPTFLRCTGHLPLQLWLLPLVPLPVIILWPVVRVQTQLLQLLAEEREDLNRKQQESVEEAENKGEKRGDRGPEARVEYRISRGIMTDMVAKILFLGIKPDLSELCLCFICYLQREMFAKFTRIFLALIVTVVCVIWVLYTG